VCHDDDDDDDDDDALIPFITRNEGRYDII
jgi:hypothetical protein